MANNRADPKVVTQADAHLFLVETLLLCYDPAEDTWYGPLETEPWTGSWVRPVPGRNGFWMCGEGRLRYVPTDEFVAAARAAGRVISGENLRRRRQEHIDLQPPVDHAKWAVMAHDFERGLDLCRGILDSEPDNVQALLLAGMLCEPSCLNQPDRALECYSKLAAMEDNPRAAYAGMLGQFFVLVAGERFAEARDLCRAILERFPRNENEAALADWTRRLSRKVEGAKP